MLRFWRRVFLLYANGGMCSVLFRNTCMRLTTPTKELAACTSVITLSSYRPIYIVMYYITLLQARLHAGGPAYYHTISQF